jgi:nucleotide-binding universal stress UspA family protein
VGATSKPAVIACAIDDTKEATGIIQAGAALAKSYGAKLAVVHVLGVQPMPMEVDFLALRKELLAAAETRLRNLVAEAKVQATHAVVEGSVANAVHEWAADHQADLLVVGRGHAQDRLGQVWSNLYSIVRESTCPVLSI